MPLAGLSLGCSALGGADFLGMRAFLISPVLGYDTSGFGFDTENAQEIPLLWSLSKESQPVDQLTSLVWG